MNKPQMILAVSGGVIGVLILAVGIFTVNAVSAASSSAEKLEKTQKEYARIFKTSNPFPNEENKQIIEKNRDQAKKWEKNLLSIFRKGEYVAKSKQTNPGYFSNEREKMIERLTEKAPKGPDGKTILVEGITFGFDKYKDGVPALKSNVPRLMEQLTYIEALVEVLYDAEIDKLKAVRREEFEDVVDGGEETESAPVRRSSRRSSRSTSTTVNSGGPVAIEPFEQGVVPFSRQRFEFVFDARQDALMKVLNNIGTMEPYAIVSKLSFVKAGEDYRPPVDEKKEEKKSRRRSRDVEEEEESANTVVLKVRPPSRTSRLVSGELREVPVTVTMTVDVFKYDQPEDEELDEFSGEEDEAIVDEASSEEVIDEDTSAETLEAEEAASNEEAVENEDF